MDKYTRKSGFLAFIWRFVLTSGTGSIFGFLVARQFFDSAMMVPIFIVLSLILGTALFVLVVTVVTQWSGIGLNESVVEKISGLLIGFVALELFLVTIFHLTNLYSTGHHDLERFILLDGQHYTVLFWLGQVLMGGVIPLLFAAFLKNGVKRLVMISSAAVIGGFSQLYVTIISGQAFPMALFPGKNVSSKFFDGVIANYVPRFPELLLGLGGVAVSFLLLMLVMRVLPFLPDNRVFKTD